MRGGADAEGIARALSGSRSGTGFLVRCPVPNHGKGRGDLHPSLSIRDGDHSLLIRCFAGCDAVEVLHELRQRGLVEGVGCYLRKPSPVRPVIVQEVQPDPVAARIWQAAVPLTGSLAERYLVEHRKLLPPFPPSLRFAEVLHPRFRTEHPCLVAGVQGPDRRLIAVQVTWLAEDGTKAFPRRSRHTFGALGRGAVRLGAADCVLGLAEGVEDALAARQLTGVTCWAAIGAGRLHRIEGPTSVTEIHVFADDDHAGEAAAEKVVQRHTAEGRRVVVRLPPRPFTDWAEVTVAYAFRRRVA